MSILNYLALILLLTATVTAQVPGNELSGIGVALAMKGQDVVVIDVLRDTPAGAQQDIHPGDRILAVAQGDDPPVQIQGLKLAQVVGMIRGPKGTTVRLTIVSPGEDESQARVVSYVRGVLKLPDAGSSRAAVRRRPKPASHHWPVVIAVLAAVLAGTGLVFYLRRKSSSATM